MLGYAMAFTTTQVLIIENSQQVLAHLIIFPLLCMSIVLIFQNLYTSNPHASIKRALVSLIKEAYRVRDIDTARPIGLIVRLWLLSADPL